MKRLLLLLTLSTAVYTVGVAGGGASCNKDKKCCKTASANGKSCSKSTQENTETSTTTVVPTADAAPAPANAATPAKSCCKGKKTACTKEQ